ncbi:MAG: SixA phosphatase family protein [Acidimicrobiales bacterium]
MPKTPEEPVAEPAEEPGKGSVRYLWILRHGKAASDAPWGGGDRERPLTARGRRDATALGNRLAEERPVLGLEGVRRPDLAICSSAVRTRQTARLIAKAFSEGLPLDSYRSLYDADTGVVLRYVREIDDSLKSALVVGHNPTMYELVWELLAGGVGGDDLAGGGGGGGGTDGAGGGGGTDGTGEADGDGETDGDDGDGDRPGNDRAALEAHGFPTCALAVLSLPVDGWEDVVRGCASLRGVFKPPY